MKQTCELAFITLTPPQALPRLMRPFASQLSTLFMVIGAPAPVLASFLDELEIQPYCRPDHHSNIATLHASHLPPFDLECIIGAEGTDTERKASEFRIRTLLSPSSGRQYTERTQQSFLHAVLSDLFNGPALWDTVFEQVRVRVSGQPARFLSVGSSEMGSSIYHRLRAEGCQLTQYQFEHADGSAASSADSDAGDIAVVGFSCRLPGAETSEEFWRILKEGRDVHGRVSFCPCFPSPRNCSESCV